MSELQRETRMMSLLVAKQAAYDQKWAETAKAHQELCHSDGSECDGGATCFALPQ